MKITDIVTIKECHSIPEIVGQQAVIDIEMNPAMSEHHYQFIVRLVQPVLLHGQPYIGPLPVRADEIEPVAAALQGNEGIPEAFLKE